MSLRVLRPGALTTVQDRGRRGVAHLGVSAAGAADALSLCLANRLVGNRDGAAGLEVTLTGPHLLFEVDAVIALVGGRLEAHVGDVPVAMEQTIVIRAGQTLTLGVVQSGVRAYLAVAGGGIHVKPVLGSRATDTLAGLGPAPLAAGQSLPIRASEPRRCRYLRRSLKIDVEAALRVIPGPRADWFSESALAMLLNNRYRVDAASDRTGVRLEGPTLERAQEGELDSEGMVTGALQVPPSGQPIVLLSNHGPTGGYPVIATLIGADLWRAAQARPGQTLRFETVTRSHARAMQAAQARFIRDAVVDTDPMLLNVRELLWLSEQSRLDEVVFASAVGSIRLQR